MPHFALIPTRAAEETLMRLKTTLAILTLAVALLCPMPSLADGCDDIDSLSSRWHDLSKFVERHNGDEGLNKEQAKKAYAEGRKLIPVTREFGKAISKIEGKPGALGKQLVAAIEELTALTEEDSWDDDQKIIDRIVEILETTVTECDKGK